MKMSNSSSNTNTDEKYRERKLNDFLSSMSIVNNTSQAITSYVKFHNQLDPRIRSLLIVNGAFLSISSLKAMVKSMLDNQYQEIPNPPPKLLESFGETRDDIDTVVDIIEASLKEVILTLQSQIGMTPLPTPLPTSCVGKH